MHKSLVTRPSTGRIPARCLFAEICAFRSLLTHALLARSHLRDRSRPRPPRPGQSPQGSTCTDHPTDCRCNTPTVGTRRRTRRRTLCSSHCSSPCSSRRHSTRGRRDTAATRRCHRRASRFSRVHSRARSTGRRGAWCAPFQYAHCYLKKAAALCAPFSMLLVGAPSDLCRPSSSYLFLPCSR